MILRVGNRHNGRRTEPRTPPSAHPEYMHRAAKGTVMLKHIFLLPLFLWLSASPSFPGEREDGKTGSVFFTPEMLETARRNASRYEWAAKIRDSIVEAAEPWMGFTDDRLWDMMFGNTITRSWMVWSDGYCPACGEGVPMYTWEIDALEHPWKVRCPHCGEMFPKNDFHAYYLSGLDRHGVFDPALADRSLLFNTEHPDEGDPLHMFGVDDGEGYVEGDHRWRFIGAYLIYGQWKQLVLGGITRLAAAYVVTGDPAYAHKAGILLDRVADLYPTFDFGREGLVYEKQGAAGYISTWHDACEEVRRLALAYDQMFDGLRNDVGLVTFLSRKAGEYGLENPKTSFDDIRRNIEDGIFRDTIANHTKIRSNYPRTPTALITMKTVLDWPRNREEIYAMMDDMIEKSTAVDGVTGEKGLTAYSSYTIMGLGQFLARFSRLEPGFLETMLDRHPGLRRTWRFHIDTWINEEYYPRIGDADGWFAKKYDHYAGLSFTKNPELDPSMFTFLYDLYSLTGDEAYIQILYKTNGYSVDGLPYNLFAGNPEAFRDRIRGIIERVGTRIHVGDVNKRDWCLAVMRSGEATNHRAFWLDYDSGGRHGHADGMNLGLYAYGLDLMPDFGYPPVQYGGWNSPKASWYGMTAAHNTVVVDGVNLKKAAGETTLWAPGRVLRVIRASAPGMTDGGRYERTVAMVDVSDGDSYLVDIFRVTGGTEHAKFMHSHFGEITTSGLSLEKTGDYGHGTQMRNFRSDPAAAPGWYVDWKIDDRFGILPEEKDIHLRYTDFTYDAGAAVCEGWISIGGYNDGREAWIPRVMVRRKSGTAPLSSTFVGVIEPYEKTAEITAAERLPLEDENGTPGSDSNVLLELTLTDGRRDIILAADPVNHGTELVQKDIGIASDAEFCLVRLDDTGGIERLVLCKGKTLRLGSASLRLKKRVDFVEYTVEDGRLRRVAGEETAVDEWKM